MKNIFLHFYSNLTVYTGRSIMNLKLKIYL